MHKATCLTCPKLNGTLQLAQERTNWTHILCSSHLYMRLILMKMKINECMINLMVSMKETKRPKISVCVRIILYPSPQVIYMKLDKTYT